MERIRRCIRLIFPAWGETPLSADTQLGEIAGWDSMTSVNLLLELESEFGVRLTGVFLNEMHTLADIAALLQHRGASVEAKGRRTSPILTCAVHRE